TLSGNHDDQFAELDGHNFVHPLYTAQWQGKFTASGSWAWMPEKVETRKELHAVGVRGNAL
ncbi:MAG TPA: hypothetical protein PK751_00940, partial [Verrucomicrobiota bacterium]|nr:hypothetical protein [Verrucomicrobiota bacterium]